MGMISEFKEFAMKGNMMDMAVVTNRRRNNAGYRSFLWRT